MALPITLEVFMRDLTKTGLTSVGKNIKDVESQTKILISALEQLRAMQQHQFDLDKAAGITDNKVPANIQALTGKINDLKQALKDLKDAKEGTATTPSLKVDVDPKDTDKIKKQTEEVNKLKKAKEQVASTPSPKVDIDTDAVQRKTNNLKLQFSQVARELPSLAMGPQMFFLAISNNLPMLAEAISDVRKQNELLKASGEKSVPLWKQLRGALFSWQTGLITVITLSVFYGREIGNWIKNLGKAKKELDATTEAQNKWNEIHKKGGKAAQEETAKLNILYNASQDTSRSLNERKKAVDELQKLFPNYFGKLTDEAILAGKAATAYDNLTKAIIRKGQAQAAEDVVADYTKKNFDLQRSINADTNWTNRNKKAYETALIERDKMWENYRKVNSGSFIVDNAAKMWLSNTSEGKLIEEYEKRTANIKKNTDSIAKNNQIINDIVKQVDLNSYVDDIGGTGSTTTKQDYATQLAEARLKAQQTVEKLRIQIMMDSREKRRAIAEQEYKETIADIDRTERETIATLDKSKKQGDVVTDADYKAVRDNATTQRALQQLALNKELEEIDRDYYDKAAEAMIAYNKEYGTYQDKRAAIAAEYAKKILKAETEGERLSLQKQYKKDINALNFEEMKSGIDFAKVFGNIDIQSTESLKVLQDKLYDYINNAAKDLDPENLKELQDAFKAIDAELLERNPFDGLKQRVEAMQIAAQELEKAKDILERVQTGEQIVDSYRTVTDAQGNTKIEQTYISAEKALQNYNKAKEKSEETTRNYIKAEQKAKEQVDELAAAISSIGDTVGGEAGEILNLISGITSFVTTSIDGITQVGKTGAQAISAVEKASVILGIISAALQIMQKQNSLVSDFGTKQYEKAAEKYQEINKLTEAVNDYRIAVAEARAEENNWFGGSGLQSLKDFKQIQEEVMKAYEAALYAQQATYVNQKGGDWILGPLKAIMAFGSILAPLKGWRELWGYGGLEDGMSYAIDNLRFETQAAKKGFLGIGKKDQKTVDLRQWVRDQGWGELFDENGLINTEIAQELLNNYSDKLVGETKATLEQLIELREKYDEYIEQLHEYVASMYEPLVDNFVDGIWDWFDEGKSALDSFKDYASDTFRDIVSDMLRTIVLDKVVDGLDEKIAAVYEEYSAGNITEKELMQKVAELTNQMIGNYQENIPVLEDLINSVSDILQDAGIDLRPEDTGVNQSPATGALTTMSQDSIATFEGIGRSMQTHLISIDKVSTEIRDQQREDSKALIKIVENTSHLLPIRELLEKIEREGLTVK